jgi:uncharacterized protein (TIGR02147 family)
MASVFEHRNYRDFLKEKIKEHQSVRGYQSRLAQAARCQRSFLSLVLSSEKAQLSRDQALGMADFWSLDASETEFFLCLVDLERAGTDRLKAHIEARMRELKKESANLTKRVQKQGKQQSSEMEAIFYSSWVWSAVHLLTTIPAFRTAKAIQKRLQLPMDTVLETLARLESMGVVEKKGDQWHATDFDIHLPRDSFMTETNHANWRRQATLDQQNKTQESLHYTSTFAVSREDAERMKEILLASVVKTRNMIPPSPSEEVFCLCVDFFRI